MRFHNIRPQAEEVRMSLSKKAVVETAVALSLEIGETLGSMDGGWKYAPFWNNSADRMDYIAEVAEALEYTMVRRAWTWGIEAEFFDAIEWLADAVVTMFIDQDKSVMVSARDLAVQFLDRR